MIDNIQHNSKPCPIGKFSNQDDNVPVNKCTECPEGTSTSEVGQVSCDFCESGKYYSRDYSDRCLPCAKPVNNCLGGISCGKNFEGFLCTKCKENHYILVDQCIKCPDNAYGQYVVAIIFVVGVIVTVKRVTKETLTEDKAKFSTIIRKKKKARNIEKEKKKAKEENRQFTGEDYSESQASNPLYEAMLFQSSTKAATVSILAKHALSFSFTYPLFPLITVPEWLRALLSQILSLLAFDLSKIASSPECDWSFSTLSIFRMKLFGVPFGFCMTFLLWFSGGLATIQYKSKSEEAQKLARRSFKNQVWAVSSFLWITTFYGLTMFHTFSVWDCTDSKNMGRTLDADPIVSCGSEEHQSMNILAWGSMVIYSVFPLMIILISLISRGNEIPYWDDPQHCHNYNKEPCYNCEMCDHRVRYGWFYNKYHKSCFNWEYLVILQKVTIGCIALFFNENPNVSYPCLITLNSVFVILILKYRPYLTTNEYLFNIYWGREQAENVRDFKFCSKYGWGENNILDVLLLLAENMLCISALITEIVHQDLIAKKVTTALPTVVNTSTIVFNNNTAFVSPSTSTTDSLRTRLADNYPFEFSFIVIFETIGLILFLSAYIYFTKEFWVRCYMKIKNFKKPETNITTGFQLPMWEKKNSKDNYKLPNINKKGKAKGKNGDKSNRKKRNKKKSKDGSKNDFRLPTNTTKRGNGKRSKRGGKSMRGRSSRSGRV